MTGVAELAASLMAELGGAVRPIDAIQHLKDDLPTMSDGALADHYYWNGNGDPEGEKKRALIMAEVARRQLSEEDLHLAHTKLLADNEAGDHTEMIEQLAKMAVRLKGYAETANVYELDGYTGPAWQHPDILAKAESAFKLLNAVDATPNL